MGDYDGVVRLDKPCSERPESNGLQRYLTDHCQLWREIVPPPRGEEGTNQRDNSDDNITTGDVVKKNFRRFVLNKLRKHYLLVVGRVMDIFEEREVNIQRIIRILQYDENNVFSTDSVFETIRTTDELLKSVGKYCNGIYDYSALDIFVQASRCQEAIKELNDFTEMLQKSILKELDLLSDHGELLHPDDFISGTYKFIIQYSGGKCTKGTKDMIQDIVEQSVRLKKGVLIFKGFDIGSVLLVYQISEAVKNYLLQFRLTKQNLLFLEGNNITGLMVDGIEIMELNKENKLGYRTSRYKDRPWLSIPQLDYTSFHDHPIQDITQDVSEYKWEFGSLSRSAIFRAIVHKKCTFKFSELRRFLNTITNQIDLPAIALSLASKEVIELHLAQELLQFTGGIREKGVKVVEIFNQLQRREDWVPFFLLSLLDSGDSSPANMELYEKLSDEMNFTDRDLDDACKTLGQRMEPKLKKLAYFSRRKSSASSIRKFESPQPYMSDIPPHVPVDSMQVENARLHQEVKRLQKMLDWSFGLLSETQKNLTIAQNKLKVALFRTQYDFDPVHSGGVSSHISPSSERRIRNVSRSADSIQHELKLLQLQEENFKETGVHGQSSTTMFDQKSPGQPV